MELRSFVRRSVSLDIALWKNNAPLANGKINNISRDGLFIELPYDKHFQNEQLEKNVCLVLEFNALNNGFSELHKLPIQVIHFNEEGIGFSFIKSKQFDFVYAHHLLGQESLNNLSFRTPVSNSNNISLLKQAL